MSMTVGVNVSASNDGRLTTRPSELGVGARRNAFGAPNAARTSRCHLVTSDRTLSPGRPRGDRNAATHRSDRRLLFRGWPTARVVPGRGYCAGGHGGIPSLRPARCPCGRMDIIVRFPDRTDRPRPRDKDVPIPSTASPRHRHASPASQAHSLFDRDLRRAARIRPADADGPNADRCVSNQFGPGHRQVQS